MIDEIKDIFMQLSEDEVNWRKTNSPIDEMRVMYQFKRLNSLIRPIVEMLLEKQKKRKWKDRDTEIFGELSRTQMALNTADNANDVLVNLHKLISMFHGTNEFGKKMQMFGQEAELLLH